MVAQWCWRCDGLVMLEMWWLSDVGDVKAQTMCNRLESRVQIWHLPQWFWGATGSLWNTVLYRRDFLLRQQNRSLDTGTYGKSIIFNDIFQISAWSEFCHAMLPISLHLFFNWAHILTVRWSDFLRFSKMHTMLPIRYIFRSLNLQKSAGFD